MTDSFKKHEQNIFVDREDANIKRLKKKENLSAKNTFVKLKQVPSRVHVHVSIVTVCKQIEELLLNCTSVVRAPTKKRKIFIHVLSKNYISFHILVKEN